MPGDTVLVHAGVYRERVAPARGGENGRPITYLAAPGEPVVVTGADVWRPVWRDEPGRPEIRSAVPDFATGAFNPFRTAYLMRPGYSLGQVAVAGRLLDAVPTQALMQETPGSWWFDEPTGRLYVHFRSAASAEADPVVELTVRDRLFAPHRRGLGFITVRGFIFERAANQFPLRFWRSDDPVNSYPQAGAVGTRSGHDWIIEHNVIRHAMAIGLDCGDEGGRDLEGDQPKPSDIGHDVIRANRIVDNGASGIMGLGSHGTRIIGNVIERNNRFGNTAPECAGIKMHAFVGGVIAGNLIRDNDCAGIWLDNGWTGARITRNLILANAAMGVFTELGFGPVTVDDNVIGANLGDGLYAHDASGVTVAHNLFFGNGHYGLYAHVISDRMPTMATEHRLVETSHWRVLNNVFIDNLGGTLSLPPETPRSQANVSDYNLFLTGTYDLWEHEDFARFQLNTNGGRGVAAARTFDLAAWQAATGWDGHSVVQRISNRRPPDFLKGAGPEPAAQLSVRGLFLAMNTGKPIADQACPRVTGINRDYFGHVREHAKVLPGPFAELPTGALRLGLWPKPRETE